MTPSKSLDLDPVQRTLVDVACISAGILPMKGVDVPVAPALAALSKEESRKIRRRFRKLWRRAIKIQNIPKDYVGKGNPRPGPYDMAARRAAVLRQAWVDHVVQPTRAHQESPAGQAKETSVDPTKNSP